MSTRMDLEQELIKFSCIMDDVAELNLDSKQLEDILNYYNHRYERLWSTFEKYIREEFDARCESAFITKAQIVPVTRIEVIDEDGRSYSKWNIYNKTFSFQDEGKTLKIFLDQKGEASGEDLSK